jgi:hypothetical protein
MLARYKRSSSFRTIVNYIKRGYITLGPHNFGLCRLRMCKVFIIWASGLFTVVGSTKD